MNNNGGSRGGVLGAMAMAPQIIVNLAQASSFFHRNFSRRPLELSECNNNNGQLSADEMNASVTAICKGI